MTLYHAVFSQCSLEHVGWTTLQWAVDMHIGGVQTTLMWLPSSTQTSPCIRFC